MRSLPFQRKLAAVMIADVVGYTTLMERDENGTHARLHEIREKIVDPNIAAHDGTVVRTTGDGMLVLFPSATEALQCALEVQRQLRDRNLASEAAARVEIRIGINLGDIIIEESDIAGDGVNIAARLETLAAPGGICVSSAIRDQVRSLARVKFVDLGPQRVKNMERPIHVFQVALDLDESDAPAPARWSRVVRRRYIGAATAAALGVAAVAIVFFRDDLLPVERSSKPAAFPAMSMAITDLASPGGDPQASQLAEALTGNLVARLGLFGGAKGRLHLVPAKSSGGEDRGNLDPRRVGSNLNVRYVLGGEVRRGSDGNMVYLQLVDTQSGKQVWSERDSLRDLDVPAADSATLRQLSEKIRVAVYSAETRRVVEEPLGSLSPTEIVLRAWDLAQKNETLQGTLEAQRLVDEALRRDPGLVFGLISRAALTDYENDIDPRPDHDRIVRDLDYYTGRAVSLDPTDPGAWTWRAVALIYLGRWDSALEANARAIELDPYEPAYYVSRAWLLAVTGRPAQALELTDRALAMKPDNAAWALRVACEAHLLLGHSDQAIANCVRSAGLNKNWFIHLLLAAAYANRGDAEQAAAEKAEVLRTAPGYTIAQLRAKRFSDNADYQKLAEAYWYEGLRKAGFPDR